MTAVMRAILTFEEYLNEPSEEENLTKTEQHDVHAHSVIKTKVKYDEYSFKVVEIDHTGLLLLIDPTKIQLLEPKSNEKWIALVKILPGEEIILRGFNSELPPTSKLIWKIKYENDMSLYKSGSI